MSSDDDTSESSTRSPPVAGGEEEGGVSEDDGESEHEGEDEDEDEEEEEEEEPPARKRKATGKEDNMPQKCTNDNTNIPRPVQAAFRVLNTTRPQLAAAVKACAPLRKQIADAKKRIEQFMNDRDIQIVKYGSNRYIRVRKQKTTVDLKTIKASTLLSEDTKARLIAENTKPVQSFKLE